MKKTKKKILKVKKFEDGFRVEFMSDGSKILIYPNSNGPAVVVQGVDDKFVNLEIESHTKEDNEARRIRYHAPVSLDALEYEGEAYIDRDPKNDPKRALDEKDEEERVNEFISTLTEVQRRRLVIKMENPKISMREIARREGVDVKVITRCFEAIRKKYLKFFKK